MKKIICTLLLFVILISGNTTVLANSISSAENVNIGEVYNHKFTEADTYYWYKFTAQEKAYDFLLTFSKTTDKLTTSSDMYIYDSNKEVLTYAEYIPSKNGYYCCYNGFKKSSVYYVEIYAPQVVTTSFSINNHKHEYKKSYVSVATESEDGYIEYICSGCDKVKKTVIPKLVLKISPKKAEYNGKAQKPKITIKDRTGKKLVENTDYTVDYGSSKIKNVGYYEFSISFKSSKYYIGGAEFYITPKKSKIRKLTAKKKAITVKWSSVYTQNDGYQIQYSTDKNFKKNRKTITVKSNETTSKTIKKLKSKKKYYVRVRTYKDAFWFNIYSKWSAVKSVKVK